MKVTQNQLQDLLELNAVDRQIHLTKLEISALGKDEDYLGLQAALRGSSADFIAANNRIESIKLEIARLQSDLDVVLKRISKDEQAMRTTSVVKDAQGLQQELRTLERRRSELEDHQLGLMTELDEAEAALSAIQESRTETELKLKGVIAKLEQQQAKLVSGLDLNTASRRQLAARVPEGLLGEYEQRKTKGTPVGRLVNSECGACRMSISATSIAELLRSPSDALVSCPECGAILVR